MYEKDGILILEGLQSNDPKQIRSVEELYEYIDTVGFLPLFRNSIDGFSLEELTASSAWFTDRENDPWYWRTVVAEEGRAVYGKFYNKKAGFISKEWFPKFVSYRRDGYDFDTLYELGYTSKESEKIMRLLAEGELPSYKIKEAIAGEKISKGKTESTVTDLMMKTFIVISGFERRINRFGEEYGWSVSKYCTAEQKFGKDYIRSQYRRSSEAFQEILEHLHEMYPYVELKQLQREIK